VIRDCLGRHTSHATKVVKMGIDSLGLEVIEIHFTPWDEFQAVDFLEVEAIEVGCNSVR
jgi:hypothetical protein